LSLTVIVEH